MGFRNPFRIQVDENDVAYVTDYSPDSAVPENFRGPAGTGRVEIVRKPSNYGWPLCVVAGAAVLPLELQHEQAAGRHAAPARVRQPDPRAAEQLALEPTRPRVRAARSAQPDIWYSFRDNATPPLGTPCLASYDGSGGTCPQLFPELYTGGVAPHGAVKYRYDAGNPSPTKFPPYYDDAIFLGEFGQDTLREVRLGREQRRSSRSTTCSTAATSAPPRARKPFECDSPMDMQFGPDGAFYLLTYGDGFFTQNPDAGMYSFEYVKGQRAPQAQLNADADQRPGAAHACAFSSEGSRDPDPGDSIEFAWDFDNDGTVDSIDPNPTHVYTANGVYTAKLTVTDSSGKTDTKTTVITVGNTAPVITITTPVEGGFFDWGEKIAYQVTVTDAEDGAGDCSKVEVTFVLAARHPRPRRGEQDRLLRARCRRWPRTPRTAAISPAASASPTPTRAPTASPR